MSRALPEAERREGDAYFTPDGLAHDLVATLPLLPGAVVWEPHAGGGAFVRALAARGCRVLASDIAGGTWPEAAAFSRGNFLWCHPGAAWCPEAEWIVGNPPFRDFESHLDHALDLAPNVAFLLRLAVMESQARAPMWRRWPLRRVYVLAERPSFTGEGTDSAAYGWFIFERGYTGPAEVVPGWLPTTETPPATPPP